MKQWLPLTCALALIASACEEPGLLSTSAAPSAADDAGADHEHEHDGEAESALDAGRSDGGSHQHDSGSAPERDGAVDHPGSDAATNGPDASTSQPTGKVPAFIAVGNCERRVMTCDGGRNWVQDQTMEGCGQGEYIVDHAWHSSTAAHTIDYGDGWFVAAWGWGEAGPVLRSRDGVKWEETPASYDDWFGGVAYGNGRFILGRPRAEGRVSTDGGATWQALAPQAGWNQDGVYRARATAYVAEGNRFFMQDDNDVWSTKTGSADFVHVVGGSGCYPRLFASGNGVVVGLQNAEQSYVCRSTDQGATWTKVMTRGYQDNTPLIFFEGKFAFWNNGQMLTSSDGLSWTGTSLQGGTSSPTTLAYSAETRTFISISGFGNNQTAYYSSDGVNWSNATTFPKGAFLRSSAFGYVDPSPSCPLPE